MASWDSLGAVLPVRWYRFMNFSASHTPTIRYCVEKLVASKLFRNHLLTLRSLVEQR